ncbi:MAG: YitT family protein [Vagococcus sp.]|uniref:YitT family protein n=1 Tax=Vagococcus sp. TaxID=1933889 RepID=UPI002FC61B93
MFIQKLNNVLGKKVVDILLIILGAFFIALGFNTLLFPNRIVSGGINGVTIILFELFNWQPGIIIFLVNLVLLALCLVTLGKEVFIKSILGSLLLPLFVSLLNGLPQVTNNPLLAAIFGGICAGVGIGLVFLGNGSTGGTTLMAKIIQKFVPLTLGVLIGICDGVIILSALFIFGIEQVLYALIALFLTSKVVDMIQTKPLTKKNILIVSTKYQEIQETLTTKLVCDFLFVPIEEKETKMILVSINKTDYTQLKSLLLIEDPDVFFVTVTAEDMSVALEKN